MLDNEIVELIVSKREGDYWDFKEKAHDNNASLLHDILCLANTVNKKNKYLILGVSDPKEDCKIVGLDNTHRKSQAELIDFLRSKNFAADNRPEVEVKQLRLADKTIDVILIYDKPQKPYYLNEDFRVNDKLVRANHIYTRVLDTNTPIDKSADQIKIQEMWRERFGIDLKPSERMVELLRHPDQWDKDVGNREQSYHKFHSEYLIEFGQPNEFEDVFSHFYINERSFIGEAKFKFFNTELFSLPYIYCDEMRVIFSCPENGRIHNGNKEHWYMYFELNSRNGAFLDYLTNKSRSFQSRQSEASFILFEDENQRKRFEHFAKDHIADLDQIADDPGAVFNKSKIIKAGRNFIFDPVIMTKIHDMFTTWSESET
jgi:hypothetical protein